MRPADSGPLPPSFIDIEFLPVDHSIGKLGKNCDQTGFDRVVQWRRPCQFIPQRSFDCLPTVFPAEPLNAKHITKGFLRDEYFLSAVAALIVKNENLVKRLFETKTYNEEGVYRIRLCRSGRWQTVTIDDFIPCQTGGGPLFSTLNSPDNLESEENQSSFWLHLLEKAYAKTKGGYKYLEGGSTCEALRDLTGYPLTRFDFSDQSVVSMLHNGMLWKLLKDFLARRGFIVTGSTKP